jgi:hypothetical protein
MVAGIGKLQRQNAPDFLAEHGLHGQDLSNHEFINVFNATARTTLRREHSSRRSHFCSGTRSRQDFEGVSSQSCQIQPQLVQPLTASANNRTTGIVSRRRGMQELSTANPPISGPAMGAIGEKAVCRDDRS